MAVHDRAQADPLRDLARALVDAGRRRKPQQRVRQERELDVLEDRLAV